MAEAKNEVKVEAKPTKRATAVKSKAKPKVRSTASSSDQPPPNAEKLKEPPKPRAAAQKRNRPEPVGPEASQRSESWWRQFTIPEIEKYVTEHLGHPPIPPEQKKSWKKKDWIRLVKENQK